MTQVHALEIRVAKLEAQVETLTKLLAQRPVAAPATPGYPGFAPSATNWPAWSVPMPITCEAYSQN